MNKFDLMNKVMVSDLQPEDKCLLVELILRADENWQARPSVERLCKVRGIKHEKNFKGADHYLPGLVTKTKGIGKDGRKNYYLVNVTAVSALEPGSVVIKHTPALEGVNTPAVAESTPSTAESTPSVEGANSTEDNTRDSSRDSSVGATVAGAPVPPSTIEETQVILKESSDSISLNLDDESSPVLTDSSVQGTPATEGVLGDETFDYLAFIAKRREQAKQAEDAYWKNKKGVVRHG